jgi:hypothetical protein
MTIRHQGPGPEQPTIVSLLLQVTQDTPQTIRFCCILAVILVGLWLAVHGFHFNSLISLLTRKAMGGSVLGYALSSAGGSAATVAVMLLKKAFKRPAPTVAPPTSRRSPSTSRKPSQKPPTSRQLPQPIPQHE